MKYDYLNIPSNYAEQFGLMTPYTKGECRGVRRPYRYSNECLMYHVQQADIGGWVSEGGGWLSKQWNKLMLKKYLKERAKWEENPVSNWDEPSLMWKICKIPLCILGFFIVLGILLGMLILAFAFPFFGVMLLIGLAFGNMGGNGDMPEKI